MPMHYYKMPSETYQHLTNPGSLFENVNICGASIAAGLSVKGTSTFCNCQLLLPLYINLVARARISSNRGEVPVCWPHVDHIGRNTTGWAYASGTNTHVHICTRTILIPVNELMRTSFSYHTQHVTLWTSTILSLLTFKNISQEPPACTRQHGGLMVTATTL